MHANKLSSVSNSQNIAVLTNKNYSLQSEQLAAELNLLLIENNDASFNFLLQFEHEKLTLSAKEFPNYKGVNIDFNAGKFGYRQQHGGGRQQAIAKAIGLKPGCQLTVLDLTAGFGQDGFLLANLGCQVTFIERSPIIAALLRDALQRVINIPEYGLPELFNCDAKNYLLQLSKTHYPDVIYLDPMFPSRSKSALVKKQMQILSQLVGKDEDALQLFDLAHRRAKTRLVVKRPLKAPELSTNHRVHHCIKTKKHRFDVYTVLS